MQKGEACVKQSWVLLYGIVENISCSNKRDSV
jgi:hypothetical protein